MEKKSKENCEKKSCLNGGTCLSLPKPSQINEYPYFACICPTSWFVY